MIKDLITGLVSPITNVLVKRQERKQAAESAHAKLQQAKVEGALEVTLKEHEIESVRTRGLAESWKDEYATVSVVSILNIVVIGGLAAAFGHPEIIEGILAAIQALTAVGVDVGELLRIVIYAAVGVSVWRKL